MLEGKKIVLGITGSIAAYKACLIIRELTRRGAEVQVVITPSGKEFITPLTLSTISRKPVVSEFFSRRDGSWNSHVELGLWADLMLIAPCTASTIGKMAGGIADNMLLTTYLSMRAPVFIAPAMDMDMYAHPATQANIDLLKKRGVHVIEPEDGELASGLSGRGRMENPNTIVTIIDYFFQGIIYDTPHLEQFSYEEVQHHDNPLKDKKIMVTAGPTYERIDPVRFVGNFSSGKMGFAIADECARRGANVTLISGPVNQTLTMRGIRLISVESAAEMCNIAKRVFPDSDAAILCAAVADFRPETMETSKIKHSADGLTLRLVPTEDIALQLGKLKRGGQRLIGFALETDNEEHNAEKKLRDKNFDFIVLNSLRNKGTCFQSDFNKITIIDANGSKEFPKKTKREVAKDIVDELSARGF